MNPDDQQNTSPAREDQYQDVSLRAVELLAKAQRAADEAVSEAQAYARDLEESAREQYRQILQRAQAAAHDVASAGAPYGGPAQPSRNGLAGPDGREGSGRGAATPVAPDQAVVDAQQLTYVQTYARVAHAQLKSVLAALNDELDQLSAMADGAVGGRDAAATVEGLRPQHPSAGSQLPTRATANPVTPSDGQGAQLSTGSATTPGPTAPPAGSFVDSVDDAPPTVRLPHGLPTAPALAPQRGKDAWGVIHDPSPAVPGPERSGAARENSWPPIFAATNAISYVFPGQVDDRR